MNKIVCTGSIALDTTRTPFKTVERVLGGSAAYFSISASHFAPVGVVSVVGEDFPLENWKFLQRENIDLTGLQRKEGKTFFFDSSFDHSLYNRTTNVTELNVFGDFKPIIPDALKNSELVYLGTIVPSEQYSLLQQAKNAKLSFIDTIEYYIKNDLENLLVVLKEVDGLVINDAEARMLTNESNLLTAGKKLQKLGPDIVIVKKGEHGCLLFYDNLVYPFPALPIEDFVDPTGAGDSFAGGLMGFLAEAGEINLKTIRKAVAYGTVMGSYAVEDFSVNKIASINRKNVEERFEAYKNLLNY